MKDGNAYTVNVAWGRRGGSLNTGSKAVKVALAVAHKKFDSLIREKRNKGYEEITADGRYVLFLNGMRRVGPSTV